MPAPLIRRIDQLVIATLVALLLVGAFVWWLGNGGLHGGLVEIDNAPPLEYRFLVDLNRADWPELSQLPGIGETLARRIIASRATAGEFQDMEELMRVNGIGPRKLEAMRRYLLPLLDDSQVSHVER